MSHLWNKGIKHLRRLPSWFYLWLAVVIFGSANAVTRRLVQLGQENFTKGENPISFSNVLFVGNLCALLILTFIYQQELKFRNFRHLSRKNWLCLLAVGVLAGAVGPGFIFEALSRTNVTNVVLLSRLEPPLVLAFSVWLLSEKVNSLQVLGGILSVGGVVSIFVLETLWSQQTTGQFFSLGVGEILAASAAFALAVSRIISKQTLPDIQTGLYTVMRTVIGTIVFFFAASILYRGNQFSDLFSPFLWGWMLIYGAIIVALGQSAWYTGVNSASGVQISIASSFTPVAGVLAAFLILGEVPSTAQLIGGTIVLIGIAISQIGVHKKRSREAKQQEIKTHELESDIGFKGC
ncbi:DMT family transporter [Capilliphycus salinus ALCB114379]|uniref:DMT family transporter n=1 Tax=Capilliphycus salinus TaxID=2768948 RepID=UPI0039A4CA57